MGVKFIEFELGMLVGSLRDSKYDNTFCSYMQHAIRALKQNRNYNEMASLINNIINAPEIYQQMSDAFLAGKEYTPPQEAIDRMRKTPLIITRELLKRLGIEKI